MPHLPPASSFEEHNISIKESLEGRLKLHSPTLSDDFERGVLVRLTFGEAKFDIENCIQEIIYSHLPSHCQVLIHWLDEESDDHDQDYIDIRDIFQVDLEPLTK